MYVRGKISDLTPIDIPEVENFITSPLNEIDYFKCQKEDLVSLRDYLLELKGQKMEYDKLISEPLKSIQEKKCLVYRCTTSHWRYILYGSTIPQLSICFYWSM